MRDIQLLDEIDLLELHFHDLEPQIRAFLPEEGRFERLRSEARALFEQFSNPAKRPSLFGLFVGVKDIFHVEGFETRAGSRVPPELLAVKEAQCVSLLKKAGALIFGKTVTTEFAYFAPGSTRNPHNLAHTPGGSSSGSAAAVAAGLVDLALGTQTIGSIIRPASFCGVVGFKPTYGRISTAGVLPLAPSADHVGFFTSTVAKAGRVAQVLCQDWKPVKHGLDEPVFGIPEGPFLHKADDEMLAFFTEICQRLERVGYVVKHIPVMVDFEDIFTRHNLLVAVEAAHTHQNWYSEFGSTYHPKTVELIERGRRADLETYRLALQGRDKLRAALSSVMKDREIDLWLSPSAVGPAPFGLESTGDPIMNLPWTHCGFPALHIPCGFNQARLPLGLQISAGWRKDEWLLEWGKDLENVLNQ